MVAVHALQHDHGPQPERVANQRRLLEGGSFAVRQHREACLDHLGLTDRDPIEVEQAHVDDSLRPTDVDDPGLDEHPDERLQREGVAHRPLHHQVDELPRELPVVAQGPRQDALGLVVREPVQLQLDAFGARPQVVIGRPGQLLGPGGHDQHGGVPNRAQQMIDEGPRTLVCKLEVLQDHHEGSLASVGLKEPCDGLKRAPRTVGRLGLDEGAVLEGQADEQADAVGRLGRLILREDRGDPVRQLLASGLSMLARPDIEAISKHPAKKLKGWPAVRPAGPAGDRDDIEVFVELTVELGDEAALAQPVLPHHDAQLGCALLDGGLEELVEDVDLPGASHERRRHSVDLPTGPRVGHLGVSHAHDGLGFLSLHCTVSLALPHGPRRRDRRRSSNSLPLVQALKFTGQLVFEIFVDDLTASIGGLLQDPGLHGRLLPGGRLGHPTGVLLGLPGGLHLPAGLVLLLARRLLLPTGGLVAGTLRVCTTLGLLRLAITHLHRPTIARIVRHPAGVVRPSAGVVLIGSGVGRSAATLVLRLPPAAVLGAPSVGS